MNRLALPGSRAGGAGKSSTSNRSTSSASNKLATPNRFGVKKQSAAVGADGAR